MLRHTHSVPQKGPWSVLFFGTDEFAVQSLQRLHLEFKLKRLLCRLEVVTVSKGRDNAVSRYTRQEGIVMHHWPLDIDLADFHIGIVVSFGHLIPAHVIQSFPLGMINIHASLLPRWRGAAPIIYALMNGDTVTGITIMNIKPHKFDIGEIILQEKVDILPDEKMPELYNRLANLGGDLLIKVTENLPEILNNCKSQSKASVKYAPKVSSKIALINWSTMTAKNVYDLQRALTGLYVLKTKFENKTVKLIDIKIVMDVPEKAKLLQNTPGLFIYDKMSRALFVRCRDDSWIAVKKLVLPGRPPMTACDFNNGFLSKTKHTLCFL
ncbi:methionyl-tRNA formyltransferase, mitochondrial isoform X2 [Orussus abietinus]|uniref:methionyl-tRNA formyltransferase, mitochondrial isoform X2 n=1 Tax=Orussus abietinus TaxID=222816 RepID=UPI000624FC71|nr:methionyl-tRNA formyltransferase, mitochondrial isoform X2 [Orussus abietinus]